MRGCVGVSKEVTEVFGAVRLGDEGGAGTKDAARRVWVTEEVMDDVAILEERLREVRSRGRRSVEAEVRAGSVLGDGGGATGGAVL